MRNNKKSELMLFVFEKFHAGIARAMRRAIIRHEDKRYFWNKI